MPKNTQNGTQGSAKLPKGAYTGTMECGLQWLNQVQRTGSLFCFCSGGIRLVGLGKI